MLGDGKSICQVTLGFRFGLRVGRGARCPAQTIERFALRCVVPWSLSGQGRGHIGARALPAQVMLQPEADFFPRVTTRPSLSLVGPENTQSWAGFKARVVERRGSGFEPQLCHSLDSKLGQVTQPS